MNAVVGNVLHLVDSLGLGGTQTILKMYFEAHAGDRRMHLYGLRTVPRQSFIAHPNVEVNGSPLRFSIAPLAKLRRIVEERSIVVLHCHLFRAQVLGFLLKLLYFPGIALVFHEHGRVVGREGESGLEAFVFRLFLRLAWRRVDRFVCISDLTRERLLMRIPEAAARAVVVANPIPVRPRPGEPVDREAVRRARGVPTDAIVVGFASRLVERKGWADFLEAIARLAHRHPVRFLLAGDGEDRAAAEARIARLGLADRGRMLGHIDWMRDFYLCLDCFVMPSHWEPHGLTQLEAQAFGVPVIVANVPGLASTVHQDVDALLCPPGDITCLYTSIERIITDESLRERLARAGVANAARYSMDVFASRLDAIHAEATGHRAPGAA